MRQLARFTLPAAILFSAVTMWAARAALAQDPVAAAPTQYKVLLENDRVRVVDYSSKPGEKVGVHSHPPYVSYYLTACKVKTVMPDGRVLEVPRKSGEVLWNEPGTHSSHENTGAEGCHILIVELKPGKT